MVGGPGYAPVPQKSGPGCWVWGLVGCGVLVIVGFIGVGIAMRQFSKSPEFRKMMSGIQSAQSCKDNLPPLRDALQKYTADHNGKYPASLEALIPKYLSDKSELTCSNNSEANAQATIQAEYTPPKPDAPEDTPVVSFRSGESSLFGKQSQLYYTRLLKNGRIVLDTVTRQEIRTGRTGDVPGSGE